MKKIISLGLIFLIFLNTFGFNLVLISLLEINRAENLELIDRHPGSISSDEITILSLKKDNPTMINSREIIYNNEMYDIISKIKSDKDIIFYCVNDKKDTNLHISFCSLNEIKDNPVSSSDHRTADILKNLLKNYLPNVNPKLNDNIQKQKYSLADYISLPSIILSIISPPPEYRS